MGFFKRLKSLWNHEPVDASEPPSIAELIAEQNHRRAVDSLRMTHTVVRSRGLSITSIDCATDAVRTAMLGEPPAEPTDE